MRKSLILSFIVFITLAACKKDHEVPLPAPPGDDARTVLLKEVVAQSLPNPYFHFTYDDQKFVTQINFASGLNIYNVAYENKRVTKMTNIQNNNTISYSYSDNRVSGINEFSGASGNRIFRYQFGYNSVQQLTEVQWFEFSSKPEGHLFKKALLSYHPDGNLARIESYYNISGEQLTLEKTDHFSHYDNKTNVDDFYLMKDFLDTYLFLPQVKLQKNNPLKHKITGLLNDYEISISYDYLDNLPVKKTSLMTQTRGTDAGHSLQIINRFTYY